MEASERNNLGLPKNFHSDREKLSTSSPPPSDTIISRLEALFTSAIETLDTCPDERNRKINTLQFSDDLTSQLINLKKVLETDDDICKVLARVAEKHFSAPGQQFEQLREIRNCLILLESHKIKSSDVDNLQRTSLRDLIKNIDNTLKEFSLVALPYWNPPIKEMEKAIKENIINPSIHSPSPSSVLNTYKGTAVDSKIFGHIHGEGLLKNSPLNGGAQGKMISYLQKILSKNQKEYNTTQKFPPLLAMIQSGEEMAKVMKIDEYPENWQEFIDVKNAFIKKFSENISALPEGGKFLIPAGWAGHPSGHAMQMSVERVRGKEFKLVLYNTGEGLNEKHAKLQEGNQLIFQPFLEITKISESNLVNPYFLEPFFEMQQCLTDLKGRPTEYCEKDLYNLCTEGLDGTVIPCAEDREKFMPPQYSGTCTWASLLAVLHTELSKKEYHKITCDIAFDSLCAYYQENKSTFQSDEETRSLLTHALSHCAQSALDAYKNSAISPAKLEEIYATLRELEGILQLTAERSAHTHIDQAELGLDAFKQVTNKFPAVVAKDIGALEATTSSISINSVEKPFSFDWINDPTRLTTGLKNLHHHISSCLAHGNSEEGVYYLEKFFQLQAGINEEFWDNVNINDIPPTMVALADLSELLFDACSSAPKESQLYKGRIYTTYAYYAAAISLKLAYKDRDLADFAKGGDFPYKFYLSRAITKPEFGRPADDQTIFSPEDRILQQKALAILENQFKDLSASDGGKNKPRMYNIDNQPFDPRDLVCYFNPWLSEHFDNQIESDYEYKYVFQLLKKDTTIASKLDASCERASLLKKKEKVLSALKDCYGKILPPAHCALRRQAFIASILAHDCIAKAAPDKNLFDFELKTNKESPELELKTITCQIGQEKMERGKIPKYRTIFSDFNSRKLIKALIASSRLTSFRGRNNSIRNSETYVMVNQRTEKGLKDRKINCSPEEFRDLQLLMTQADFNNNDPHLEQQTLKTIDYFSGIGSGKLADHDMRMVCRFLLFEDHNIEKLLSKNKDLTKKFAQFVTAGWNHYIQRGDIAAATFFIELGRNFDEIAQAQGMRQPLGEYRDTLTTALKNKNLQAEEKTLLYQQLAASYLSHPPTSLTKDDCSALLQATVFINTYPLKKEKATQHLQSQIAKVLLHWQEPIQSLLNDEAARNEICSNIIAAMDPGAPAQPWLIDTTNSLYKSIDGSYALDVKKGLIYFKDKQLTSLPLPILKNSSFQKIFSETDYPCRALSSKESHYEFIDERQIVTQIKGKKIFQQINNQWYELIFPQDLGEAFMNSNLLPADFIYLCEQSNLWAPTQITSDEKFNILVRNKKGEITHQIALTKNPQTDPLSQGNFLIESCQKGDGKSPPLTLVDLLNTTSSLPVQRPALYEIAKKGMLFKDLANNLKELELTSLGLSFDIRYEHGMSLAYCKEKPGYFLAPYQGFRGLAPIKGACVLENKKGEKKLVIPYGTIVPQGLGSLKTEYDINVERNSKEKSITFELDQLSHPIVKSTEQKIFLAYLFLEQKNYSAAKNLLEAAITPAIALSSQERALLNKIAILPSFNKDASPHATAVVLYAIKLLADTPSQGKASQTEKNPELSGEQWCTIARSYYYYKQQLSTIPNLALIGKEEKIVANYLLKKLDECRSLNPQANVYAKILVTTELRLLDNPGSLTYESAIFDRVKEAEETYNVINKLQDYFRATDFSNTANREPILSSRPGKQFPNHFLDFYEQALKEKERFLPLLAAACQDKEIPSELLDLLKGVIAEPTSFPATSKDMKQIIGEMRQGRDEKIEMLLKKAKEIKDKKMVQHEPSAARGVVSGDAPKQHSRNKGQKISPRLPPDPDALKSKLPPLGKITKEIESFTSSINGDVKLSEEEISQLSTAVGNGAEGKELAARIRSYWERQDPAASWHTLEREKDLPKLKLLLQISCAEEGKRAMRLQQELLSFANAMPSDQQEALLFGLEKKGGISRDITVQDLILFAARPNNLTVKNLNPALAAKENELLNKTLLFLQAKAFQQQIMRALNHLNLAENFEANTPLYNRACEMSYRELVRVPPYLPGEHPELLVFEALTEMGLYEWQVKDLLRMMETPNSGSKNNIILEKVMGAGKTKVYLPLLALNKADGEHLSTIVVHSSQYDTVAQQMQTQSHELFGQLAHTLQFTRESDSSEGALKKILDSLKQVSQQRHFLIVTDKTLHSLSIAFDELWQTYLQGGQKDPILEGRIEVMQKILALLRDKGRATFDEADLLLNCRYEVVYAIGDPIPIAQAHCNLVADLYQCLSPEFAKITPFTKSSYDEAKQDLITKFVDRVVMTQMKGCDREKVIIYLQGQEAGALYVDSLDADTKNLLAIALYEFQELLPSTLEKRCGENYGYSDKANKLLAVPYLASGVPNPTAEFSFPYTQLNYILQTLQNQGVTPALIKKLVIQMQQSVVQECKDPTTKIEETEGYNNFMALCSPCSEEEKKSFSFLTLTDNDITTIVNSYKKNPDKIYNFAKKYLFPLVAMHKDKLDSTSFNLASLFLEVQGFTGTPWNSKTFPRQLELVPDPNSAGKTLGIIWKNSQTVHALEESHETKVHTTQSLAADLVNKLIAVQEKDPTSSYNAFIDVGALFNGIENQTIAEEFLKKLPETIKGVLFFKGNHPYVLERNKPLPTPYEKIEMNPSELYLFYDQWHTTGTDYKIGGKSLLSIGKNNTMRDLEQGYMRDRQAEQGSRVEFVISPEEKHFLMKDLKIEPARNIVLADILLSMERNQERELQTQLIMAAFGKIKQVIKNQLRILLLDKSPADIMAYRERISPLLGETMEDLPYQTLGQFKKNCETKIFFDAIITDTINHLRPLLQEKNLISLTEETLRKDLQECVDLKNLPDKLPSSKKNPSDQLVEQQSQQHSQQQKQAFFQKEMEMEVEYEPGAYDPWLYWNWKGDQATYKREFYTVKKVSELDALFAEDKVADDDDYVNSLLKWGDNAFFLSLDDIISSDPELKEFKGVFDIDVSYNFIPVIGIKNISYQSRVKKNPLLSKSQLLARNFLVCKDKSSGKSQVRIISEAEAGFFFNKLPTEQNINEADKEIETTLCKMNLLEIQSTNAEITAGNATAIDDEVLRKIVQIKFFDGQLYYTKSEQKLLRLWIEEKGVERMKKLFLDHILHNKPFEREKYGDSTINKIFDEMSFHARVNF